jgi:hypothetical protein
MLDVSRGSRWNNKKRTGGKTTKGPRSEDFARKGRGRRGRRGCGREREAVA